MTIRNRIKELRQVRAGDLIPDLRNWRRHPDAQRSALQTVLDEVGYADAVIARESPDGLVLIDGHLRADLDPEQTIPVLVTDLDESEAGQVLATLDPLAAMAYPDDEALDILLQHVAPTDDNSALAALFEEMHGWTADRPVPAPGEEPFPDRDRDDHPLGIMNFIVSEAQRKRIETAIRAAAPLAPADPLNENSHGNALAWIVDEWQRQRT